MELQEQKTVFYINHAWRTAAEAVLAVNCVMQELFFIRLKSACTHGWVYSLDCYKEDAIIYKVPALLQVPVVPSEGL